MYLLLCFGPQAVFLLLVVECCSLVVSKYLQWNQCSITNYTSKRVCVIQFSLTDWCITKQCSCLPLV